MMTTHLWIKPSVLLCLAFSVAYAFTEAAAESVPYDLSQETYKTETLFSYDGCLNHHLMGNSGDPKVFKNNVYLAIIAYGRRPRILQVPLDGGDAKIGRLDPDYEISDDAHQYFTLGVDKTGYIHVVGGMHGGAWKHWISEKPEDISKFVRSETQQEIRENVDSKKSKSTPQAASQLAPPVPGLQGPPGIGITYPHFHTDAAGDLFLSARGSTLDFRKTEKNKIVHIGILDAYDAENRSWRLLGADIPMEFGGHPGNPVTVWGDCFENGPAGHGWYVKNNANFVASPDNKLHFLFRILNYSPPTQSLREIGSAKHATGKDLLYAWSSDGGRTLQRADGSKVQWPVCAKPGPYQPDVIYSATADYAAMEKAGDGKFPGLVEGQIQLDWKGRPMIQSHSSSTDQDVVFRLENGKWGPCPANAFGIWRDNVGVLMKKGETPGQIVRLWDENQFRVVKLGNAITKLDEDYLRDTGTMIYTTKTRGEGERVINVMRTTIQRPEHSEGKATY